MRTFRGLAAGAALLIILVGFVAVAVHSGTDGRAIATAATPAPWDVEWNVEVPELIAGTTARVSAEAILTEPSIVTAGPLHDPIYNLAITGSDPALELTSAADVLPEDVSDGAEWELRAQQRGEATIEISLTYKQSWCFPCDTHFITETTIRQVTVLPLPGDVDCNVRANSIDAALILQLVAAIVDELTCQDAADVNDDGSVNAVDATLILQYAAGLLDGLTPVHRPS